MSEGNIDVFVRRVPCATVTIALPLALIEEIDRAASEREVERASYIRQLLDSAMTRADPHLPEVEPARLVQFLVDRRREQLERSTELADEVPDAFDARPSLITAARRRDQRGRPPQHLLPEGEGECRPNERVHQQRREDERVHIA